MDDIEKLYLLYRKMIFKYLYGLIGNYHIAEELTQETFFNVLKSLYKFREESGVTTWIYSIARNVYFKWIRKNKLSYMDIDNIEELSAGIDEINDLFEKSERNKKINYVLSKLPNKYREIIILRDWQGLHYEEIAAITSHSVSWVKVNIYRARKVFREEYSRLEGNE